jgi:predicted transcriptional regulator
LKKIVTKRIVGINNRSFPTAINPIIEAKSNSTIYITTPEQRKKIEEGREQIAKGEYFTNEDVEMEIDRWLKK